MSEYIPQIEFNSMAAIMQRIDKITLSMNKYRDERNIDGMVGELISYYKEICIEMTKKENENVWIEIETLSKLVNKFRGNVKNNFAFLKLDKMDIQLRKYAKKYGFLTKVKKDAREAVMET